MVREEEKHRDMYRLDDQIVLEEMQFISACQQCHGGLQSKQNQGRKADWYIEQ
jgi:hypothetical protein